jgi:hypothetical protein
MSAGAQRGPAAAVDGVGLGLPVGSARAAALRRPALLAGVLAGLGVAVFFGAGPGHVLP